MCLNHLFQEDGQIEKTKINFEITDDSNLMLLAVVGVSLALDRIESTS